MADVSVLFPLLVFVIAFFSAIMGVAAAIKAFYIKVEQGTALIVNDLTSQPKVRFTGALVWPIIYKKELMKISLITLEIDRRGKDGLICHDNLRADITVAFYMRVNETQEDVLKVAKSIGVDRASDKTSVYELFQAKFSEALKTVGKKINFVDLFENRQDFRDRIIEVIGQDLNGYALEDVAIDYLEQTPKDALDPNNILDAEGIKKITELTAQQNVKTNIYERDEELAIKQKNVTTKEAMLALERQQAEAEEKQAREVAAIQAREQAETVRIQEEEREKAESKTIHVDQVLLVQKENQQREIEIAEQNRLRAVAVEEERVIKARDLEQVIRNREVEIKTIEAEKAVEIEKKEIANVIRERVSVDKTVAIEEERIKEVREVSEADRAKQVKVLAAEAIAEEDKVKQIKFAEAEELAAQHKATETVTLANAQLEATTKEAEAKKKMAEGVQAEQAAVGLAEAKVMTAKADAKEKEGLAEASVIKAQGDSKASATKEIGVANADVTREQFRAEADGLTEKFSAMDAMSKDARDHEEFRMTLETSLKEALASISAGKEIAKENAGVLAQALEKAHIDIVGGEEHFFDNFAKSLSIGKAIDGLANKSSTITSVLKHLSNKNTAD